MAFGVAGAPPSERERRVELAGNCSVQVETPLGIPPRRLERLHPLRPRHRSPVENVACGRAENLIEGAPFAHPLRGSLKLLTIAYATEYGRLLGATRVRLIEPMPGLIHSYAALGFSTILQGGRALYCEREI